MKTTLRKTAAAITAVVTAAMGMISMSAFAYQSKGDWSVYSVKGAPNGGPNPTSSVSMYTYGNYYQTDCTSISGSNDREVRVSVDGNTVYTIRDEGKSAQIRVTTEGNRITFTFTGYSKTSTCQASGSVGYYN